MHNESGLVLIFYKYENVVIVPELVIKLQSQWKKRKRKISQADVWENDWIKAPDTLISGQTYFLPDFPYHPLFPNCLSSLCKMGEAPCISLFLKSFSAAPSFPQLQRCPTDQPFPQLAPYSGIRKTNIHSKDVAMYFSREMVGEML